jgi:hypothetical protein
LKNNNNLNKTSNGAFAEKIPLRQMFLTVAAVEVACVLVYYVLACVSVQPLREPEFAEKRKFESLRTVKPSKMKNIKKNNA